MRAIRDLDYAPEIVVTPSERTALLDYIDTATLPTGLRTVFVEAKAESKPIIVEFSGPG